MFLCAVARPRFNEHGYCTFDGKIGVWAKAILAARSSQNRASDKAGDVRLPL